MGRFILMENRKLDEFDNKQEAETHRDNMSMWFPENQYTIIEQNLEALEQFEIIGFWNMESVKISEAKQLKKSEES